MKTAADVSPAIRDGITHPESFAPSSIPRFAPLTSSSVVARMLTVVALFALLLIVRPVLAEDSESWTFGKSDFSLSVVRVPLSFSLFDGGRETYRYGASYTTLSLSLVREKEALANIRIEAMRNSNQPRSLLAWAGVNAGYGQLLESQTTISRGYNAAVFAPRASVYLKTSFTF